MRCRDCGYDNHRNSGKCDNCGFRLEPQTDSMKDQRAAMQKALVDPDENPKAPNLVPAQKTKSGLIGLIVFLVGAAGALFIFTSFERAEVESEIDIAHEIVEEEIPIDSLPLMLGTDIVYVFNAEGTSASPRTNVNLALIPEGTKVSFLGSGSMSIQPVVNYMLQKINGNDFRSLLPDSVYAWKDSTETSYFSAPILPVLRDTTGTQPVELKILFTDGWIRCMIEEFDTDVAEPISGYGFNQSVFTRGFNQAVRSIERKNTEDRPVHITMIFPSESTFGEAMDIIDSVAVYTDSLGYEGFNIRWVNVTN